MSEKITLKSGSTLELYMAPYSMGWKLVRVLANELKQVGIDGEALSGGGASQAIIFEALKNGILQLLGSQAFEDSVYECLSRCLYNGDKVTRQTFEDETARGDFLPCVVEVTKFNVLPFVKNLDLSFLTGLIPTSKSQELS